MDSVILLVLVIILVVGAAFLGAVLIIRNLLYVCEPNRVLIFSGGIGRDGQRTVGYRAIKGGRALRAPLLESVDELDLTNMIIDVAVTNAYSKGGIPLTLQGVANIKIASVEPLLGNAIQRFLGKDRAVIAQIAKDTLEGNLRGVLSQLTPEQVNEDKIAFAEKLLEEAEHDLARLGLSLDTLKIQNVFDDVGYLNSLGRKQSAELFKRSKIAEAQARTESVTRDASNRQGARIAELEAEKAITKAQTEKRIADAVTRREALIAEEVGQVRSATAKAESELRAQEARVEQVKAQLLADVVAPAQAVMEAAAAEAKGNAQKIVEDGKATAAVLNQMIDTWQTGGENARDIFLMQKLDVLMSSLVGTIGKVRVDRLTMLPGGSDSRATRAVRLVEELKGALGIDIPEAIERLTAARSANMPAPSTPARLETPKPAVRPPAQPKPAG
jgi:flotillin